MMVSVMQAQAPQHYSPEGLTREKRVLGGQAEETEQMGAQDSSGPPAHSHGSAWRDRILCARPDLSRSQTKEAKLTPHVSVFAFSSF